MICANMERNKKLSLLIIRKSANPRCLKNVRIFHEEYLANKKALMTGEIFTALFKQLVKEMKRKKTKIVLPPNTISKTNCGQNNYLEPWSSLEFYCATFLPSLFFWMPWHINQAWNTYHGRRCPSLRYYPRLSTEPEVCDLVSRYIFSRNSPHQSRITNFFECLQRNKKVTVFVAQASSYQKHNYKFWHLFCVFIERMRA